MEGRVAEKGVCKKWMWGTVIGFVVCLPAASAAWQDSDFFHRRVVAHPFVLPQGSGDLRAQTVIGAPRDYIFQEKDTILDIARYFDLGYNELYEAYPEIDPWLPPRGETVKVPTFWVLPSSGYEGVVVNIPEMRLYYFSSRIRGSSQRTVITFPVGLGREDWPTPKAKFQVRGKTENPTWVIPESIKRERIQDEGWTENFIPGGRPDNPLGTHRIELTLPLYTIHGTNNPWAVGRLVTHGCIRLYPEDIKQFFPLVRPGTVGEFVYEPVKVGVRNGKVYVEVHKDIYNLTPGLHYEAQRALREAGLDPFVDSVLLAVALEEKSGVPVDVTRRGGWKAGIASHKEQDNEGTMLE